MSSPVALITGAGRGIGAASAHALAGAGYDVLGVYRRDETAAAETRELLERAGVRCEMVRADLTKARACTEVVQRLNETFARVDVLVHAAGLVSSGRLVADTTDDELNRLLAVHFLAPWRLTRDLLPLLRRSDAPSVVFVSSSVTRHMRAGGAPYNAAKAAVEALARTLAAEERAHGVRVNIVSPGLVDTELGRRFVTAAHGVEIDALAPLLPFGRVCSPADVGDVVGWLASASASYITAENIAVNGGDDWVASDVVGTRAALSALNEKGI